MAVITPEGTNDGFNFLCLKTSYIRFLHMESVPALWLGTFHYCCLSNIWYVQISCFCCQCTEISLMLVWFQLEVSILWKVTVVTSTSRHSTRRPVIQDHCHPGWPYRGRNTSLIGQYGVRIVTYCSVVKLWFTLRASARAVAPDTSIPFHLRLWKRSNTWELVPIA